MNSNTVVNFFEVYCETRRQCGVPVEDYPFFLDEAGFARLPEDVRERALLLLTQFSGGIFNKAGEVQIPECLEKMGYTGDPKMPFKN